MYRKISYLQPTFKSEELSVDAEPPVLSDNFQDKDVRLLPRMPRRAPRTPRVLWTPWLL